MTPASIDGTQLQQSQLDLAAIVPTMQRSGDFPPSGASAKGGAAASVPASNTGPKYPHLAKPIIDACAVTLPEGALKRAGLHRYDELCWWLFGFRDQVAVGTLLERSWQFCDHSATLIDQGGEVVGKLGLKDDGKIYVSLMGKGCSHVPNWHLVESRLAQLQAYITRVDIAVDDLQGHAFNVEHFKSLYEAGEFNNGGRPPKCTYVDDMGSRDGCTLTIGKKGNKQLQVYEKGRQLKDPDSEHSRVELRVWKNKVDIPLDVLTSPGKYFGAAYKMLAQYVVGEVEKMDVRERNVNATTKAMVTCLRNQAGSTIGLIFNALSDYTAEEIVAWCRRNTVREGFPARFKGITGNVVKLVQTQLTKDTLINQLEGSPHHEDHDRLHQR